MVTLTVSMAFVAALTSVVRAYPQPGNPADGRAYAFILGVSAFPESWGGPVPACVNDAVTIAKLLAQQDYYREDRDGHPKRIKLVTLGCARDDKQIPGVERLYDSDIKGGDTGIGDALADLANEAGAKDLVMCYVTTHGTVYPEKTGKLRLLLPDYDEKTEHTYVEFDKLIDVLHRSKAQVVYVINACESGGGSLVGAGERYLGSLFEAAGAARFVLTACQENEKSRINGPRTYFGEALEKALTNPQGKAVLFANLAFDVKATVQAETHSQQTPLKKEWTFGDTREAVVSRPKAVGPVVNWLEALKQAGPGEILPNLDREDALRVLATYVAALGDKGSDALAADEVTVIRAVKLTPLDAEALRAWEDDRFGPALAGTDPKSRREKWIGVIKAYAGEQHQATTAEAYYRALADAGLPPVIAGTAKPLDLSAAKDPVPVPYGTSPPATPQDPQADSGTAPADKPPADGVRAWQVGRLAVVTTAADPRLQCEPLARAARVATARLELIPYQAGLTREEVGAITRDSTRKQGETTVALDAPISRVRVTVASGNLVSSPRTLVVRCPANLTVTEPAGDTVTDKTVTLKGQVWCSGGSPKVEVTGQAVTLGEADKDGVRIWTCANVALKEGPNLFNIKALDGTNATIGEIALKVTYTPYTIVSSDVPESAEVGWRIASGAAPDSQPTVPVEAYDKNKNFVFLKGTGKVDRAAHVITVEDRKLAVIRHATTVAIGGDGVLQRSDLDAEPVAVPLQKVARLKPEMVKRTDLGWELAPGTWRIAPKKGQAYEEILEPIVVVGGAGAGNNEVEVPRDAAIAVNTARFKGCSLTIAIAPGPDVLKGTPGFILRGPLPGGAELKPSLGQVDNLTAGDYDLVVDDSAIDKYHVDANSAKLRPAALNPVTYRLHVVHTKSNTARAVTIPFRLKVPPCKLPIPITVASRLQVVGDGEIALEPGQTEVDLPAKNTAGDVRILATDSNLEYFRGTLVARGETREVAGRALSGSFNLGGPLDKLTDIRLAAVSVPGPDRLDEVPRDRWTKMPVGTYNLTAKLKLPGLASAIPLSCSVPVPEGGAKRETGDLLAGLADPLRDALKKAQHDVAVTVMHKRNVVGKSAAQAAPDPDATVVLERPSLTTDGADQILKSLGAKSEVLDLLPYSPPQAKADGGTFRFSGLREGTYAVKVTSKRGVTAYDLKTLTVPAPADAATITEEFRLAALPFTLTTPDKWAASVGGKARPMPNGNEVPLFSETDAGTLELKRDGIDVWQGRLEPNGTIAGNFVHGDFELTGAVAGLSGKLTPVAGAVPYLDTDKGAAYPGSGEQSFQEGPKSIKWADLPVGKYRLTIAGFTPVDVTIPLDKTLAAKTLEPDKVTLNVSFTEPVTGDAVQSCLISDPDSPYYVLHTEKPKKSDLKATNWSLPLPPGGYTIRLVWRDRDGTRWQLKRSVRLPADAALVLGKEGSERMQVTVALTVKRRFLQTAPNKNGDMVTKTVSNFLTGGAAHVVKLLPAAGGEPIEMKWNVKAAAYTGRLAPGDYTVVLDTKVLDTDGTETQAKITCTSAVGGLKATMPKDGCRWRVETSCLVAAEKHEEKLDIGELQEETEPPEETKTP
jgi:hypothetical protein